MKDIQFLVFNDDIIDNKQIIKIYQQHDFSHGGFFDNDNILPLLKQFSEEEGEINYYVCAVRNNKLVGYAVLTDGFVPGSLYIDILAVDKDHIRQGIGKSLINYIVHHSKGFKTVSLDCATDNKNARAFYESLGFEYKFSYPVNTEIGEIEQNHYIIPTSKIKENDFIRYNASKAELVNKDSEEDVFTIVRKKTRRDKGIPLDTDLNEENERKRGDDDDGLQM